jgi:BlaI family transcriptional regulator, penicillinase repressor
MARPPAELLTDRETQIMDVLWSRGPSTSEAVRQALPNRPHDSTIRTLLRILKNKGYVHIRGRQPALYEPAIPRSLVQTKATKSLLSRLFGGSVEDLVLRLLEDETLSREQLDQLRKQIRRQRKGDKS